MRSALLKTEALCWLRFGKQMDYVCTEAGYWSADVLGVGPTFSIEVEVKVSIADLQAEFRNKLSKHAYYAGDAKVWSPNYFYFLVPPEIEEKAVAIVAEKMPKAGVLVYVGGERRLQNPKRFGEALRCARRPQRLHGEKPGQRLIDAARKRCGSEMVSLHIALDTLKGQEIDELQELKKSIVDAVFASHGAGDWEHERAGADGGGVEDRGSVRDGGGGDGPASTSGEMAGEVAGVKA